jgi:hypothetical protein
MHGGVTGKAREGLPMSIFTEGTSWGRSVGVTHMKALRQSGREFANQFFAEREDQQNSRQIEQHEPQVYVTRPIYGNSIFDVRSIPCTLSVFSNASPGPFFLDFFGCFLYNSDTLRSKTKS